MTGSPKLHDAVLSLGSNVAEADIMLNKAIARLRSVGFDIVVSEFYNTPDISGSGVIYSNAVMSGRFSHDAASLQSLCKDIENSLGRSSMTPSVAIDIDIVVFDGNVLRPQDYGRDYFTIGMNYIEAGRLLD